MTENKTSVDFSYKADAPRYYYDIEALPSLFSIVFWCPKTATATLFFYGLRDYDYMGDEEMRKAVAAYFDEPRHRETLGLEDGSKYDVRLIRVREGDEGGLDINGKIATAKLLTRFIQCRPLMGDEELGDFAEYVGWNSWDYDLPMLIMARVLLMSGRSSDFTPMLMRRVSDTMIGTNVSPLNFAKVYRQRELGLGKYEDVPQGDSIASAYTRERNGAIYRDGHIDIAKMLRQVDETGDMGFPPGLKKEEAKLGLDIVADGAVSISDPDARLDRDELIDFLKYNLHDVAATCAKGRTKDVRNRLFVRDVVREMFPYTSARAASPTEAARYAMPERDITEASLTARVLVGENRVRPHDWDTVRYDFPIPDGKGGHATRDFLNYMKQTEPYMPDDLYTFFDHWRGRNTSSWADLGRAKAAQPINKDTAINVPYYRKGADGTWHPIDAYIRVSTGGAHGSMLPDLHEMDEDAVQAWTRLGAKPAPDKVPTLDLTNVIHADYTSYYPVLLTKMGVFKTEENIDRYSQIYDLRVQIKTDLAKKPDRSTWDDSDWDKSDQQLGLKLQLNSASGAAGMHRKYSLLPLDNKILSMRLIGNMAIWALAQRMVNAGGYILSTNTDGIYVAELTLEESQAVIDGFVRDYDIPVDPEIVPRFINRDVSNRLELMPDRDKDGNVLDTWHANDVRGRLRSGGKLFFDDTEHGHSVAYPLAVGNAVIRYMVDDPDWTHKPYDRDRLISILEQIKRESDVLAWCHVYSGTAKRHLTVDGIDQQKVNRVVLVRDGGGEIGQRVLKAPTRAECATIWKAAAECGTVSDLSRACGIEFDSALTDAALDTICPAHKVKGRSRREPDRIVPIEHKGGFDFENLPKSVKTNGLCLAYKPAGGEQWRMLETWHESRVTGYPEGVSVAILNGGDELWDFDLDRLDMDGYLRWAESMLRQWKVGADLKDGILTPITFDDALTPKKASRATKHDTAIGKLAAAYATVLAPRRR